MINTIKMTKQHRNLLLLPIVYIAFLFSILLPSSIIAGPPGGCTAEGQACTLSGVGDPGICLAVRADGGTVSGFICVPGALPDAGEAEDDEAGGEEPETPDPEEEDAEDDEAGGEEPETPDPEEGDAEDDEAGGGAGGDPPTGPGGQAGGPTGISFTNPSGFTSIPAFLGQIVSAILFLLAAIGVVLLVLFGIRYMTASSSNEAAQALGGIRNVIIGLILVVGAYLIVQFVISAVLD